MAGQINHTTNILIESKRLESTEETGNIYGSFDLAGEIKAGFVKIYQKSPNVTLVYDAFCPSLDPQFTKPLILTLALGNFPSLGLS